MRVVRPLLVSGNSKLGTIWHFDIPPIRTCPGRSVECVERCYCTKGRFVFPQVMERLDWCYEMSKRKDFARLLSDELYRKGVLVCRFHVSGDLYSPTYAEKVKEVVERSPHCRFFLYTRSYVIPPIMSVIRELAKLDNMSVWLSADRSMAMPSSIPTGCRVAWMMVDEQEAVPEQADLVFRDRPLRKLPVPLPLVSTVCPTETVEGKQAGVSCSTCQECWK